MRPDVNHFWKPPRPPAVGDIGRQLRELPAEAAPPYDFAEFRRRSTERSAQKRQIVTWPHAAAAAGLTAFVAAMAMLATGDGRKPSVDGAAAVVESDANGSSSARTTSSASGSEASSSEHVGAVAPETVASAAQRGAAAPETGVSVSHQGAAAPETVASVSHQGAAASENTASAAHSGTAAPKDDPAEQARAAREWLARQPAEPALVRAGPRLAVASLEDRIAWFDDTLTDQRLHGASAAQLQVLQQERARLVSSLAQVRYAEALVADGS
jgi:hypothetical protein